MCAKHIFVTGKVQGVGYRHFAFTEANSLGLVGWARNLPDGRVEIEVAGDESRVAQFVEKLRKGPVFARVDNLDIEDRIETVDSDEFIIL